MTNKTSVEEKNIDLKDPNFWRQMIRSLLGVVVALGLFTVADSQFFELQLEAIIGAIVALIGAVTAILTYIQQEDTSKVDKKEAVENNNQTNLLLLTILAGLLFGNYSMAQTVEIKTRECECVRNYGGAVGVCFFWRNRQEPRKDPETERIKEDLRNLRSELQSLRSDLMRPIYQLPPGGTPQQIIPPGGVPKQNIPEGGNPQQIIPPGGRILIELPNGGQPRQQIGGNPDSPPRNIPNPQGGNPQQSLPNGGQSPSPITQKENNFIRYSLFR
jgi:hypothetical protein